MSRKDVEINQSQKQVLSIALAEEHLGTLHGEPMTQARRYSVLTL